MIDISKVAAGYVKSVWLLRRYKPEVIFAKGGYVCLPMGWASRLFGVPLVLHDSDARPGLTNILLAKSAQTIATGYPLHFYEYPPEKSVYTGVPIDDSFTLTTPEEVARRKTALGYNPHDPLVVAIGGGLGAAAINNAMLAAAKRFAADGINLYIIAGKLHGDQLRARAKNDMNVKIVDFVASDMADVLGAADVVVTRASATALQELAGLGRACVIVPSMSLADQQKNAQLYATAKAGVVLGDKALAEGDVFYTTVAGLVHNLKQRQALQYAIHSFWRPDAARDVARSLSDAAKKRGAKHGK